MIATTAHRRRRKVIVPATPPTPGQPAPYVPSPEFIRAYSRPITLDGASWSEDGRYMRWTLPVNSDRRTGGGISRGTPRPT